MTDALPKRIWASDGPLQHWTDEKEAAKTTMYTPYIQCDVTPEKAREADEYINHHFRGKTICEGHPLHTIGKLLEAAGDTD